MKLKASEAVFIAICILAVAAAVLSVSLSRKQVGGKLEVSLADTQEEQYDVSVINLAAAEDFMKIRGIGEVKARAIVEYRGAIGGFKRVSQLTDVDGISDSTLARIIEYFYGDNNEPAVTNAVTADDEPPSESELAVTTSETSETIPEITARPAETAGEPTDTTSAKKTMREVNINSATADEIADSLMIEQSLAEEIVAVRVKIHYFSSVQELYFCEGMNDKIYQKVKNYIKMGE